MLITLLFGLMHGFGFAADLLQLQLPPERLAELLVGFNLGVEAGQLTLVAGATLVVVVCESTGSRCRDPSSSTCVQPSSWVWEYSGS